MDTLRFGYKYFKKDAFIGFIAEILSFMGIFAEQMLPLLSGVIIDYVIKDTAVTSESGGLFFHFLFTKNLGEVHTFAFFKSIAIIFSILVLTRLILIYIRDLIQEKIGLNLETTLRYATYEKLMSLDSQTIAEYNSGELLQLINGDTMMFKELFCHRIPYFGDAIFIFLITFILIASINISFLIIPLILSPFIIKAVLNFKTKARMNFKEIRAKSSEMNLTTQENIAAVRIVRSFTNEELEKEKFEKVNNNYLKARLDQVFLTSKFDLTINTLKQIAYVGTIVICSVLVMKGQLTVGYILASSTYVVRIMNTITSINNHILNMQQQTVAGLELKSFMERESLVHDNEGQLTISDTPTIELKDVSLLDGDQVLLKDINLSIPYGKKLGVVGETGSGKSVLLKALVRTKDITEGQITIDGRDIKDYSLKTLRDTYSYVFQDVFLFSNTIESNIAYARPDASFKQIRKAAELAQAASFVDTFSEKYDTIIGERGLGISGGQKQRISIARAFLKNSPVFILDDSTSALDVNTERVLLKDIHDNFSDKTVIITAHRLSSVKDCDEIIYLKDGCITERGTFDELMAMNGDFAKVYNIQMEQQKEFVDFDASKEGGR